MSLMQRFEEFQPTKTMLAWVCAGAVVLTVGLGFTVGGWVTGGTAQEMAANAAEESRAQLAAAVCVENFLSARNAQSQLTELKGIDSSFRQRQFIEEGNWAVMPDSESASRRAASLCAEMLSEWEVTEPAEDEIIEH